MIEERAITHVCNCFGDDCDRERCPCYENVHELCIKGSCCKECIVIKTEMLRNGSQYHVSVNLNQNQNGHNHQGLNEIQIGNYNTCTCKNTRCLKSYCSCFQNGGYCNEFCKCEDCENQNDSL